MFQYLLTGHQPLVKSLLAFEDVIFVSHNQVYSELRTVLGYEPPAGNTSSLGYEPPAGNTLAMGAARTKFVQLMVCYCVFDRIWLYNPVQTSDVPIRAKTLKDPGYLVGFCLMFEPKPDTSVSLIAISRM
jgi:hypothetical protein